MKKVFVRWMSDRNSGDGRRASAVGVNESAWHLVGEKYKTKCGIKIGPYETYELKPDLSRIKKICSRCAKY